MATSKLLDLPLEIRHRIYTFIFPAQNLPPNSFTLSSSNTTKSFLTPLHPQTPLPLIPDPPLTLTCTFLRHEALPLYYSTLHPIIRIGSISPDSALNSLLVPRNPTFTPFQEPSFRPSLLQRIRLVWEIWFPESSLPAPATTMHPWTPHGAGVWFAYFDVFLPRASTLRPMGHTRLKIDGPRTYNHNISSRVASEILPLSDYLDEHIRRCMDAARVAENGLSVADLRMLGLLDVRDLLRLVGYEDLDVDRSGP